MAVVHVTQWYVMDYSEPNKPSAAGSQEPDMKHLIKPRGRGYSFRMVTPKALVGTQNPWTRKPFGKEIKLGLQTQRHAEAVRMRDVRLGHAVRYRGVMELAWAGSSDDEIMAYSGHDTKGTSIFDRFRDRAALGVA